MKTYQEALSAARRLAKQEKEPIYILHLGEDEDAGGYSGYQLATSYDMETYYQGEDRRIVFVAEEW